MSNTMFVLMENGRVEWSEIKPYFIVWFRKKKKRECSTIMKPVPSNAIYFFHPPILGASIQ